MQQSELITDRPDTVTVNGDGLLHWWKRDQAGEVFIYKMVIVENGIYGLSLQWLDGRRLYRFGETAIAEKNLSTLQCSSGTSQSRTCAARPVKIMKSAEHHTQPNVAAGGGGTAEKQNAQQRESARLVMQPAISFKPLSQCQRQQATYKAMELFK